MKTKTLLIFICFGFILFSCKKDEPINDSLNTGKTNEAATGTLDLGNYVDADFYGSIIDEAGNPISNVQISIGAATTTTDANGQFVIENTSVHEKLAYVKANKTGYFPGSRSLIPSLSTYNYVEIQLMEEVIVGAVQSGTEATVSINSGASIVFKGQYVDANGNPYNGDVTVTAKYLPALAPETSLQMPGMLYAQNEQGESGALITYGMMVVELYGSAGQELNIAEGSEAIIHMPIDPQQLGNAPATIPLWHFDEVAGYWVEEGTATLTNGLYTGVVDHFSFWNCDMFLDDCEHHGIVTDNQGNPLSAAFVQINTNSGNSASGYTNADGTFFTYLPANQNLQTDVSFGCNSNITTYNVGPYTTNSVSNETYISDVGTNVIHIVGNVVDCNQGLIDGATGYIPLGNNIIYFNVVNGEIDVTVSNCTGAQNLIVGLSHFNQGNVVQYETNANVIFPTTDLGQITLCDTNLQGGGVGNGNLCDPNEFFEVIIDGNTVVSDTCAYFQYHDSLSTSGFTIQGVNMNQLHLITSPDVNSPGTYYGSNINNPGSNAVIYTNFVDLDYNATHNFTTNILYNQGPGGYFSCELSGTYFDMLQNSHSVEVTAVAYIP